MWAAFPCEFSPEIKCIIESFPEALNFIQN